MFVPINVDKDKYKEGDIVLNRQDINIIYGVFTIGHEFTVIGKDGYGYILKDNELGIIVKKINSSKITLKVDHKEAKIIRDNRMDRIKFKIFILDNCPNKEQRIDDRDYYDACKLNRNKNILSSCVCELECIKYISNDKIKDNKFISLYLRNMKLKKIKKVSD
jgi:hypothetical protein